MGCYAASPIEIPVRSDTSSQQDNENIGGLVGENEYGIVHSSYWTHRSARSRRAREAEAKPRAKWPQPRHSEAGATSECGQSMRARAIPIFTGIETSGQPIVEDPFRYGGGDGTSSVPYRIETPAHFANLGCYPSDWDKAFVLTADLDLAGADANDLWPIGILTTPFTGVFDGNGHTVANLVCRRSSELYVGLFGSIGKDFSRPAPNTGEVLDLDVRDVNVSGCHYVGGLAAHSSGTLSCCSVTGQIVASGKNAGGLTGPTRARSRIARAHAR